MGSADDPHGNAACFAATDIVVPVRELIRHPETGHTIAFFKMNGPCRAVFGEGEDDVYEIYSEALAHHLLVYAEGRRFIIRVDDVVHALRAHLRPDADAPEPEPHEAPAE